ncbi:hypothetical protein SAMN05443580_1369 [Variovorax sp. OV084]|jgi:hypothetical protein|nr:hypothetical protein SAMN05443580_1369 [Variovorax sp. OV084]
MKGHCNFFFPESGWRYGDRPFMEQLMTSDINETSVAAEAVSNGQVIVVLNDLPENSRDGQYGFRACAAEVAEGAQRNHDQIKALRDQYRSAEA